jgi:hypothetical protein
MKKLYTRLFILFLVAIPVWKSAAQTHPHCANPDVYKGTNAAGYSAGSKVFEDWISKVEQNENAKAVQDNDEIYTIPVVVHVLHNGEAEGVGKNLSNARVQSQIDILNNDYSRATGTPGFNTHPSGADTRIRFCLATKDPSGNASNGIVRVNTNRDGFEFLSENTLLKGFSFWDPAKYLNIWSCQINGNLYIGYAQYPIIPTFWSDSLPMPQPIPDVQPDGVVIDYRVFGDVPPGESGPFTSYNKGRTTTHEIGHYLGLLHIWGDGSACADNATDYCEDTPPQATYTSGCPTGTPASCTPGVPKMKENYLDYTNDACMNIFTKEQKKRMRIVLRNCIRRNSLLQTPTSCGIADTQPVVTPPPAEPPKIILANDFENSRVILTAPKNQTIDKIEMFSMLGQRINVVPETDAVQSLIDLRSFDRGIYNLRVTTSLGQIYHLRFPCKLKCY